MAKSDNPLVSFSLDKLEIRVVGITPLLTHNPMSMASGSANGKKSKMTRTTAENLDPDEQAAASVYRDDDGDFAFPNEALCKAIIHASELMKLKTGPKKMDPGVAGILMGGMNPDFNVRFAKLIDPKTNKPLKDYKTHACRVVMPSGGSVVRGRASFFPWAAVFCMLIDAGDSLLARILSEHLPMLIRAAGMQVGVGDNRAYVKPTKGPRRPGGPFGKFDGAVVD